MEWRMVVGLGNPGSKYERTPHNIGFMVVARLATLGSCDWHRSWRFPAHTAEWRREAISLLLVRPATYMNASGQAVAPMLRKRGWTAGQLIVVLDDADLPLGSLRIRPQGSAGGHRGLQSVIDQMGTEAIARVRIGVGRQAGTGLADHVLAPFGGAEWPDVQTAIGDAAAAVLLIAEEGVDRTMNRFNRTVKTKKNEGEMP